MYSGYGTPQPANNPFVTDPTNAQNRFPDISSTSSSPDPHSAQFTSWLQPGGSNGIQTQQQTGIYQQQYQPQSQFQQQQQFSGGYNPAGAGYLAPQQTSQFQPTSGFGQQLLGQLNGTGGGYSYLNGQSSASSQTSYNPAQQQLQNNPGYIPQLDPYASLGQGWDGSNNNQSQQSSVQTPTAISPQPSAVTTTSRSVSGVLHPREHIKKYKAELESWDGYSWKQLLNSFDELKIAWQNRKREIEAKASELLVQLQYGGGGYYAAQIQQEGSRLQALSKEAESHADSVAASSFQMHEVYQNYRRSGDAASKRRVREASNAALQSLPDWPSQGY